jgi:hypothetical protein
MRRGPGASRHCEAEAIENHRERLKTIISDANQSLVLVVVWVVTKAKAPFLDADKTPIGRLAFPGKGRAVRESPLPNENHRRADLRTNRAVAPFTKPNGGATAVLKNVDARASWGATLRIRHRRILRMNRAAARFTKSTAQ